MFGTWPSSKRKRIDAVWLPVAMSSPVLRPHPQRPVAEPAVGQLAEELDEHPLRVGHATVEAHAVVEARPGAHLPGRSGDRHRHHVGDEREHRRGERPRRRGARPRTRRWVPSPRRSRLAHLDVLGPAVGARVRRAWRACAPATSSGALTVRHRRRTAREPVVDGDAGRSDGDERGLVVGAWPARAAGRRACPPPAARPPTSTMSPMNGWLTNCVEHHSTSRWVAASIATTDTARPVPP